MVIIGKPSVPHLHIALRRRCLWERQRRADELISHNVLWLLFDRAVGGSWFIVDGDLLRTRMDGTVLDCPPGSYRTRSVSCECSADVYSQSLLVVKS